MTHTTPRTLTHAWAVLALALAWPGFARAQQFTYEATAAVGSSSDADEAKAKEDEKEDSLFKDKAPGSDDERGFYEMHHWGVWLADPAINRVNARETFLTAMPTAVETTRPRRMKNEKKPPQPINVVTFYGPPTPVLDVDLRVKGGTPLAHWPPAQIKSARLHWPEYQLADKAPDDASWLSVAADHWFNTVRKSDALILRKGSRAERLLTYDFEAQMPLPLKIEGGPDKYQIRSTAPYPLHDLVIVLPEESGRRIGWLDLLPAAPDPKPNQPGGNQPKPNQPGGPNQPGVAPVAVNGQFIAGAPAAAPAAGQVAIVNGVPQAMPAGGNQPNQPGQPNQPAGPGTRPPGPPVTVTMSELLPKESEPLTAQTTTALTDRLVATGLNRGQIDLLISLYGPTIFGADSLIVAWRLPAGTVDEVTQLVAEPEPAKTVRVVLVVARNLDPVIEKNMQMLVDQLGNPKYKTREAAEERLKELGSLAFPVLRKSLTSTDPEIAFRAERLLLEQKQQLDGQPQQ